MVIFEGFVPMGVVTEGVVLIEVRFTHLEIQLSDISVGSSLRETKALGVSVGRGGISLP